MNLRTISADKLRSLGLATYQGLSAIADERGFRRWLAVIAKKRFSDFCFLFISDIYRTCQLVCARSLGRFTHLKIGDVGNHRLVKSGDIFEITDQFFSYELRFFWGEGETIPSIETII